MRRPRVAACFTLSDASKGFVGLIKLTPRRARARRNAEQVGESGGEPTKSRWLMKAGWRVGITRLPRISIVSCLSVLKPSRRAKPGADVRSSERACRSEFERPSEAAKRNMREPEDAA